MKANELRPDHRPAITRDEPHADMGITDLGILGSENHIAE